jgi:hypothetical protein
MHAGSFLCGPRPGRPNCPPLLRPLALGQPLGLLRLAHLGLQPVILSLASGAGRVQGGRSFVRGRWQPCTSSGQATNCTQQPAAAAHQDALALHFGVLQLCPQLRHLLLGRLLAPPGLLPAAPRCLQLLRGRGSRGHRGGWWVRVAAAARPRASSVAGRRAPLQAAAAAALPSLGAQQPGCARPPAAVPPSAAPAPASCPLRSPGRGEGSAASAVQWGPLWWPALAAQLLPAAGLGWRAVQRGERACARGRGEGPTGALYLLRVLLQLAGHVVAAGRGWGRRDVPTQRPAACRGEGQRERGSVVGTVPSSGGVPNGGAGGGRPMRRAPPRLRRVTAALGASEATHRSCTCRSRAAGRARSDGGRAGARRGRRSGG